MEYRNSNAVPAQVSRALRSQHDMVRHCTMRAEMQDPKGCFAVENHVFMAVLLAAFLHAGWNSVIKVEPDRVSALLLLALVQAAIAIPLLPFVARPATESWIWILASAALHVGYKVFLMQACSRADLSQAYPLARGTAPLIVTVWSVVFLGVTFTPSSAPSVLRI